MLKFTKSDRLLKLNQAEEAAAVASVNNKQEEVAIPNAMAEAFRAAKGE